jgi:hypothetical protein
LDNHDLRRSTEKRAEQPREIWLWFQRHNTAAQGGESANAITRVRADVKNQVTGGDKAPVEAPKAPLAQRDRVVDRQ